MNDEMRTACSQIWMKNKDRIIERCRYKLHSCPDEIDDVVADVSYHLCVAILNGKIHTDPSAWLRGVTENCIKQKYSEMARRKKRLVEYNEENVECGEDYVDAEDLFLDSLIPDTVIEKLSRQIIDELRECDKALYEAIYIEKKKLKQIAAELGITVSAVKERNYRLTKRIKKLVKIHIEEI